MIELVLFLYFHLKYKYNCEYKISINDKLKYIILIMSKYDCFSKKHFNYYSRILEINLEIHIKCLIMKYLKIDHKNLKNILKNIEKIEYNNDTYDEKFDIFILINDLSQEKYKKMKRELFLLNKSIKYIYQIKLPEDMIKYIIELVKNKIYE